ncbi:MAG: hypothetical protein V1818_02630 [Candidatus Aenigmatarchaeota archaeon]
MIVEGMLVDGNNTIFPKNYVLNAVKEVDKDHPGIYKDAIDILSKGEDRDKAVSKAYSLFNKYGITDVEYYLANKRVMGETEIAEPFKKVVRENPYLKMIGVLTHSDFISTFANIYEHLDPLTPAKILPFTTGIEMDKYGVIKKHPTDIIDSSARAEIAEGLSKIIKVVGIGDKDWGINLDFVGKCHAGIEIDNQMNDYKRKKGKDAVFVGGISDLPNMFKEIYKLPDPKINNKKPLEYYFQKILDNLEPGEPIPRFLDKPEFNSELSIMV